MKIAFPFILAIALSTGCKVGKQNTSSGSSGNTTSRSSDTNEKTIESSNNTSNSKHVLDGNWFFVSIPGKAVVYSELFPNGMPTIDINISKSQGMGYGGCNKFSTKISVKGDILKIEKLVFITKMACPNMGDQAFAGALESSTSYQVKGNELTLYNNKVEMMKLRKVN